MEQIEKQNKAIVSTWTTLVGYYTELCYPPPPKKKLVLFSHLEKLTSKLVLSLVSTLERVYLLKLPMACIISLAHWVSLHLWKFIVKQGLFKYPFPAHPFVDNGLMACFKCIFTIHLCCSTKMLELHWIHSTVKYETWCNSCKHDAIVA